MPSVAEIVGRTLASLGVDTVFGVVGSGNLVVSNALHGAGARFVAARHETGAVSMADGWARTLGKPGAASVHQGPGLTNAITGLTEAAKGRTPLVVLAGETPATAIGSNFRIDQVGLVSVTGAVPERVEEPASAAGATCRAMRRAQVERRPVVLMLPTDVQRMQCPETDTQPDHNELALPAVDGGAISSLADLLEDAERPVIVAGRGALLAQARQSLTNLGERVGAVLTTSAMAHGLFHGERFDIGIAGGFSTPLAQELLSQADLVLAFGASLNRWTTRNGSHFAPDASIVQVDLEASAIGLHHRADLGIVGDARAVAEAVTHELESRGLERVGFRRAGLIGRLERSHWREQPYVDSSPRDRVDPRALSIALDDLLPDDRTLALDSGHFMGYPAMYMRIPDPAGFVFTQAFQSIGLGLSSAIGAAVARPDRVCVAALGDGGALMSLPELETAARLGLRLLIVVYNDAAYGAEVHHFGPQGHPLELVRFPDTDFAGLARAAGAGGVTARSVSDLAPVAEWLEDGAGPLMVDAKVDPSVCAEWLEEAFRAG